MKGYTYQNIKYFINYLIFAVTQNAQGKHNQTINNALINNDIERDVNFTLANIDYFINFLPNKIESLQGKTLLEIGPGQNFGISLALADLGLKNVILIDPFLIQWDENYHIDYYRTLLTELEKKYINIEFQSIKEVILNNTHQAEKLICYQKGLENNALELENDSIDISFSNAVFEHFVNPQKAIQTLNKVTKKGGLGFHQIDLRDHRNFDKPLEFLTFPRLMFQKIIKMTNAHFGNRLRYSEYNAIFERNNFDVVFKPDSFADDVYLDDVIKRVSKYYSNMKRDEIRALGGRFFIIKSCQTISDSSSIKTN